MFKRVLVLVIFLFGVFWWLTSRDNEPTEPNTDVVVVETENEEGGESEVESDTESAEVGESEVEDQTNSEDTATPPLTFETTTEPETVVETPPVVVTPAPTPRPTTVTRPVVTPTPVVVAPTQPRPMPVAPTVPAPAPAQPEIPERTTDVKVFVYEWGLDLSDKTIPAGTINFQVQNDGRFTHEFNVSGFGNLGKVTPSQKTTFTMKLPAGEYEAFSDRNLDLERGVRDTFTVVE